MKPQPDKNNRRRCLCPGCSLYGHCNGEKQEKLFCATQHSACPMDASKMCICGGCPVYAENQLTGAYFCIHEIA